MQTLARPQLLVKPPIQCVKRTKSFVLPLMAARLGSHQLH
jgi:hypothetical protein